MIKLLLFMKKKEGLSDEAFRTYYETGHAPLALKYLGRFMTDYRRNYVRRDAESAPDQDFDVITEIWFKDRADLDAMWATVRQPDIAAEMEADGDNFRTRESRRYYVVDECISTPMPDP